MNKKKQNIFYMALLLPAIILFIAFFIIPVVQSLYLSFTDSYGMRTTYNFVGLLFGNHQCHTEICRDRGNRWKYYITDTGIGIGRQNKNENYFADHIFYT